MQFIYGQIGVTSMVKVPKGNREKNTAVIIPGAGSGT